MLHEHPQHQSSPLRGLMRSLASALHTLFQAQFADFWLPSKEANIVGGGLHPVSWQTGKKSSRIQFILIYYSGLSIKARQERAICFGNKRETSSAIIYIQFGRKVFFLVNAVMLRYIQMCCVIAFMFSLHQEFLISLLFSVATKLLIVTFQA